MITLFLEKKKFVVSRRGEIGSKSRVLTLSVKTLSMSVCVKAARASALEAP